MSQAPVPNGTNDVLGSVPKEILEKEDGAAKPADGLPPPTTIANVEHIKEIYEDSLHHMEKAKGKFEKGHKHSAIDWETTLYTLFLAWIVNFGRDPKNITPEAAGVKDAGATASVNYDRQNDSFIHKAAEYLHLEWVPFVDLALAPFSASANPASGPYAGVFVHKGMHPFMVLAFKGTTYPFEITTDALATAVRVNSSLTAKELYNEKTHMGMAQGLWSAFTHVGEATPAFDTIWAGLHSKGTELQAGKDRKIPVYVTGHSLGAGYATQAYVELLRRTELERTALPWALHDAWIYGAPRVFLNAGAVKVKEVVNAANLHIWRVANFEDIVPNLPVMDVFLQVYKHVDVGYRTYPVATEAKYLEDRPSEAAGPGETKPGVNDGYPPKPDGWIYHWPEQYYLAIKKILKTIPITK